MPLADTQYYIYVWRNITNGKCYVGKGKGRRAVDHPTLAFSHPDRCPRFYSALRKYGKEAFVLEILSDNLTEAEALTKEVDYISKLDSFLNGYNLTLGGEGFSGAVRSAETKEKIRQTKLGALNPNYGKKPNPESIAKRLSKMIGFKHTVESRAKMTAWQVKTTPAQDANMCFLKSLGAPQLCIAAWFNVSIPTVKRRTKSLR